MLHFVFQCPPSFAKLHKNFLRSVMFLCNSVTVFEMISKSSAYAKQLITCMDISRGSTFDHLQQNVLPCDRMTAFARFPEYWLSLIRYSTSKSSSLMLNQNLIKTSYAPVVISIS